MFVRKTSLIYGAIALMSLSSTAGRAQESRPAFEVVSIRKNVSGGAGVDSAGGDTYQATAASIQRLIINVYELREDQLVGVPSWVHNDRFDISAKAAQELTVSRWRAMVRTMLEDRFGLVLTKEQRDANVFVLVRASRDERLGPDIYSAAADCVDKRLDPIEAARSARRPSSGARPTFFGQCGTADGIAAYLSGVLKTTVINQTGLSGRWDYVLAHSGAQPTLARDGVSTDSRPDVFRAVEDQLGLKLERRRGLEDVWRITSIHPPTEN